MGWNHRLRTPVGDDEAECICGYAGPKRDVVSHVVEESKESLAV